MGDRIPMKRGSKEPYDFAGNIHWSDVTDWTIRNYGSIFNVPIEREFQFGVDIVIVQQKHQCQEYWLCQIDSDYLKERFFQEWIKPLTWSNEAVECFLSANKEWITERIEYNKERELLRQARTISLHNTSRTEQEWYEYLKSV